MKLESKADRQLLAGDAAERVIHLQNPKTTARPARPTAVVLHYTAVRAASAPVSRLATFRPLFGEQYEAALAFVEAEGRIPGALMLSLNNASNAERQASWDVTIGREGIVVQCNLQPTQRFTWHAGRSLDHYRKVYDHRNLVDRRGVVVYDGATRQFAAPILPNGKVMDSGNPPAIGIEVENWGQVLRIGGKIGRRIGEVFRPIPDLTDNDVVEVSGKLYERVTPAQYAALVAVCRAYRDFYDIPRQGWYGHRDIVPDRRVDPEPPLDLHQLVEDVYTDRLEVAEVSADADVETAFLGEPLEDNHVG